MNNVMSFINQQKIPSLSGYIPEEAFVGVYGKEILDKLTRIK